jgi:hypothetical protein
MKIKEKNIFYTFAVRMERRLGKGKELYSNCHFSPINFEKTINLSY